MGESGSEILKELTMIRQLLLMGLMRSGASQADIATALSTSQSSVSRMMGKAVTASPKRKR